MQCSGRGGDSSSCHVHERASAFEVLPAIISSAAAGLWPVSDFAQTKFAHAFDAGWLADCHCSIAASVIATTRSALVEFIVNSATTWLYPRHE